MTVRNLHKSVGHDYELKIRQENGYNIRRIAPKSKQHPFPKTVGIIFLQ